MKDLAGEIVDATKEELILILNELPFWLDDDDMINVPEDVGCPECGNTIMAKLIHDDDGEIITCQECHTRYAIEDFRSVKV